MNRSSKLESRFSSMTTILRVVPAASEGVNVQIDANETGHGKREGFQWETAFLTAKKASHNM